MKYKLQVASDIIRDGLGVEVTDEECNPMAEVFRSDKDRTLHLNTFGNALPANIINDLLKFAARRLSPFEDGTPLNLAAEAEWCDSSIERLESSINEDA